MLAAVNLQCKRTSLRHQTRTTLPIFYGLILFACGSLIARAQTLDSVQRELINPPKTMRPLVRWWWPGGDVTSAEVRREVRVLDEAGFGGAEIEAFRIGLKTDMPAEVATRVNDCPTPSFYRNVST